MADNTAFIDWLKQECATIAARGADQWFRVGAALEKISNEYTSNEDRSTRDDWEKEVCASAGIDTKQGRNWKKVYDYLVLLGCSRTVSVRDFGGLPITGFLAIIKGYPYTDNDAARIRELLEYLADMHRKSFTRIAVKDYPKYIRAAQEFEGTIQQAYDAMLEADRAARDARAYEDATARTADLVTLQGELTGFEQAVKDTGAPGDLSNVKQVLVKQFGQWMARTDVYAQDIETISSEDIDAAKAHLTSVEAHIENGETLKSDAQDHLRKCKMVDPQGEQVTVEDGAQTHVSVDVYNEALATIEDLQGKLTEYQTALHLALAIAADRFEETGFTVEDMHLSPDAAIDCARSVIEKMEGAAKVA